MLLTRRLAFGGISSALIILVISFSYISPTADLAAFTLSSLFIAMVVIEADIKTGFAAYVASSLLITAFYGIYYSLPFILLFGLFPLIKGFIESRFKILISYFVKALYFVSLSILATSLFKSQTDLALSKINDVLSFVKTLKLSSSWVIVILFVIVLFIYDYALTLLITFYQKRLKPSKLFK